MAATRVIVKIKRNLFPIPYQDAAQNALPGIAAAAWQAIAAAFPTASLNRLLNQSQVQLQTLLQQAQAHSGQAPPDLFSLMAVDVSGPVNVAALVAALKTLPFVETAYQETPHVLAAVNPSDDPLAPLQGYLNVAPFGIEAFFAWSLDGSDGSGVKFADIEFGWNLTHEDLVGAGIVQLNTSMPGNDDHSTACLGIVLGQDNTKGIIGTSPKATGHVLSAARSTPTGFVPDLPDAFLKVVGALTAGDVCLIEQQTASLQPVEIDPHIAMLIRTMTLLGIIVIEPAGNGGHNLDLLIRADGTTLDPASPLFFDSTAIVVGARQPLVATRWPNSCFGGRVNCHAWGDGIVTTSSAGPSAYKGVAGQPFFGGTSGASAIVAGAAVMLQGIAKKRGTTLTPARMRDLLSNPAFNTATLTADRIGMMPNLRNIPSHI